MASIWIDGQQITITGDASNVHVSAGGSITVGGVVVASGLSGVVDVKWEGPLARLRVDGSVTVNGDVHGDVDAGGSVSCGSVGRSVDAGGSVTCVDVGGNVDAGGSVKCGGVRGKVR